MNFLKVYKTGGECMSFFLEIKGNVMSSYKLLFLIIILLMLLVSINCGVDQNGFKKAVVTKQGVRFSFEYPYSYKDINDTLNSSIVTSSLLLHRVDDNNTWDNSDTEFRISITDKSYYPSAKAYLDATLRNINSADSSNQIEILKNSSVKVAGVEGYLLEYTAVYSKRSHFLIYLFFDYNDLVWTIYMDALATVTEKAKDEFEYIYQSFEFVD